MSNLTMTNLIIRIQECPESESDAVAFRKEHGLLPSGSNHVDVTLDLDPELAKSALFSSYGYLYLSVTQIKALMRLEAHQRGLHDVEIENALAALKGAARAYDEIEKALAALKGVSRAYDEKVI
jgi:hypothetical protein